MDRDAARDRLRTISDDPTKLNDVSEFDEVRQKQYQDAISRAELAKGKNPLEYHETMQRNLTAIAQDLGYFVGKDMLSGATVPDAEQFATYRSAGLQQILKALEE